MAHFCSNCGHPVQENDMFCRNCGAKLRSATPVAPGGPSAEEKQKAAEEIAKAREILLHPVLPEYRKAVLHLQYASKHGEAEAAQKLAKLTQMYRKIQEFCQKEGAGSSTEAGEVELHPIELKADANTKDKNPEGKHANGSSGDSAMKTAIAGAAGAAIGSVLTQAARGSGSHVAEAATPDLTDQLSDEALLEDADADALLDELIVADALDNGVLDGSILDDPAPAPMEGAADTSDSSILDDSTDSSSDDDDSIGDFFSDLFR